MSAERHPYRRLWVAAARRLCERRSVILGYHGIGTAPVSQDLSLLLVPPGRFRAQIELLCAAGFRFCTVAELAGIAAGGTPPPGYAAISFDDGMRNNYTTALPILRELGVVATVYVTIGFIDSVSPWVADAEERRMLDEAEIRELAAAGWELGAHTMTHPDLTTLDYESCREEIQRSRVELERIGGVRVQTFAYPSGRYSPAAIAATRDSGLLAAVTTGSGSWAPYELTRAMIGARDPMGVVMLKLTDRYEPLLGTAPLPQLRRASKRVRARAQRASVESPGAELTEDQTAVGERRSRKGRRSRRQRSRVLLTNAEERSMIAACRSLQSAGYDVACASHTRLAPGQWSRCCARRVRVPRPEEDSEAFVEGLRAELERDTYQVLLPGSDSALLAISRGRGQLEHLVQIGLPAEEIVERSLSRQQLARAAEQVGLSTPRSVLCTDAHQALPIARELGFPLVLKSQNAAHAAGTSVRGAGKGRVVANEHQMIELLAESFAEGVLIQRWVAGDLLSCGGVMAGERLLGLALERYLRMWPADGGSVTFGETVAITPALEESVHALILAIGWEGIFELELIDAGPGRLTAIDLNPRPYGSMALAGAAGAPLASLWVDWLLNRSPLPIPARARPGYRYRWEDGDLRHGLVEVRAGRLWEAGATARPRRHVVHAHFELSDPVPLAMRAAHLLEKALARTHDE